MRVERRAHPAQRSPRSEEGTRRIDKRQLDGLRRGQGELENHLVDEFVAARLSRREFLRRGTVVGMSLPVLGALAASAGNSPFAATRKQAGKPGATIRVGTLVPTGAIDPLTVPDRGGEQMLGQTGQFLVNSDEQLNLRPVLATSCHPNSSATVWTFKIRKGVTFSDGKGLTADDVVYTYKLQSDPKNGGDALSVFGGVLEPDGVEKVDDFTVAFHLNNSNAAFPYACSSDNFNLIILPKGYDPAKWQTSFLGTGPFVMKHYSPGVGASFVRNNRYWGPKALPIGSEWTFYESETPMAAALEAGDIDYMQEFTVAGSPQLLHGGYKIYDLKSAENLQLSMRNDIRPFTDARVRRAVALSLDRPAIISALLQRYADIGNDNPFAPVFPETDPRVPQRHQDLKQAANLLAAAGYPRGFSTELLTQNTDGCPAFAQVVAESAAKLGIHISLTVESPTKYYGTSTFGSSDWLDGVMSLVHYASRSTPNVYLTAPLQTITKSGQGRWNAARFNNPTYDRLSKEYIGALDLSLQRKLAGQIETLLLQETPIIFPYFIRFLSAAAKTVSGVYPTQVGQIFLASATKR